MRISRELRRPLVVAGGAVTAVFLLTAVFGPWLAPHDATEQNLLLRLQPPGTQLPSGEVYLLGTDHLGRDILSRILVGSRISFVVATLSVIFGLGLGAALGLSAGYFGRAWESVVMRLVDLQMAFPFLFLGLIVAGLFGPSLWGIVTVLTIWGWVAYARIARAMTLSLRRQEFMEAAAAIGARHSRIIWHHLLPNVIDTLAVVAALQVGRVLIAQAGLEFLGLGVPPPEPTWGGMLSDGRTYLSTAWWASTFPGLVITFVVLGVNFLGNGLRASLRPGS